MRLEGGRRLGGAGFCVLLILILGTGCSNENPVSVSPEDLVGDWRNGEIVLVEGPSDSVSLTAQGAELTWTLTQDRKVLGQWTVPAGILPSGGAVDRSFEGTWKLSDETLTFSLDGPMFLEDITFSVRQLEGAAAFSMDGSGTYQDNEIILFMHST